MWSLKSVESFSDRLILSSCLCHHFHFHSSTSHTHTRTHHSLTVSVCDNRQNSALTISMHLNAQPHTDGHLTGPADFSVTYGALDVSDSQIRIGDGASFLMEENMWGSSGAEAVLEFLGSNGLIVLRSVHTMELAVVGGSGVGNWLLV